MLLGSHQVMSGRALLSGLPNCGLWTDDLSLPRPPLLFFNWPSSLAGEFRRFEGVEYGIGLLSPKVHCLREGRAQGPGIGTLEGSKPGDGADRGGASRAKFLGCLQGQMEQDWKCLLSKQGIETPHPGGLAGVGKGMFPPPQAVHLAPGKPAAAEQWQPRWRRGSVPFPAH